MENRTHVHDFFFNDDGFEVCLLCGACTTLREQRGFTSSKSAANIRSTFADILINNNLGFIDEVEKEYREIKLLLHRGYSNRSLYAYCMYNVFLRNGVYYSLNQVSNLFQIDNFVKLFCQIKKNQKVKKHYFDVADEKYIESALHLFLSQHCHRHMLTKAINYTRLVKEKHRPLKFNFLVSISLFFALKDIFNSLPMLMEELASNFSINIRTFKSVVKDVYQSLEKK